MPNYKPDAKEFAIRTSMYQATGVGPRGPAGANGAAGATGATGSTGATGASGAIGTYAAQSQASAATLDFATAQVHKLTLTGSPVTITLSGAVNASAYGLTVYLVQDGTGGRLVTWPASVKWSNGSVPVLSTAINAVDIVVLESYDGGTTWFANLAGKGYA